MPSGRYSNILVRATNWLGDAVMSIPALRALRGAYPEARITLVAKPWVADLYARETFANEILPYTAAGYRERVRFALSLRPRGFDCAILLQNAFEAAGIAAIARIPEVIGYDRDGRGFLLTRAIRVPQPGEIPAHERYYYLELLRRGGIIDELPASDNIELEGAAKARCSGLALFRDRGLQGEVVAVSPGAAFGSAKQWLPERFAEAAAEVAARRSASVVVFGSPTERELGETVAARVRERGVHAVNLAGQTSLAQFLDMLAACAVLLTNDSGAMHAAAALRVPVVAIFGSTNDQATGPVAERSRIVKQPVECSPCLLRECPIDHRCMTGVAADQVAGAALDLLK